jgi:hypothetical protein
MNQTAIESDFDFMTEEGAQDTLQAFYDYDTLSERQFAARWGDVAAVLRKMRATLIREAGDTFASDYIDGSTLLAAAARQSLLTLGLERD